jgi:putative tricarboxylic transport membrane protein
MEKNLRRALTISDGDLSILWDSPLAVGLLGLAAVAFLAPFVWSRLFPHSTSAESTGSTTEPAP